MSSPQINSRRPAILLCAIAVIIGIGILIYFQSNSDSDDALRDPQPQAKPPVVEQSTSATPSNMDVFEANLHDDAHTFPGESEQLGILVRQDRFSSVSPSVDSLIQDAQTMNHFARDKDSACIAASNEQSVMSNCIQWQSDLISTEVAVKAASFTLTEVNAHTHEWLESSIAENVTDVRKRRSDTAAVLDQLEANPAPAQRYGVSLNDVYKRVKDADAYLGEAEHVEVTDPVRCEVLLLHARLVYEDISWRTFQYRVVFAEGQSTN